MRSQFRLERLAFSFAADGCAFLGKGESSGALIPVKAPVIKTAGLPMVILAIRC